MSRRYFLIYILMAVLVSCVEKKTRLQAAPENIIRFDRFTEQYPAVDSGQIRLMQPAADLLLGVINSQRDEPVDFEAYRSSPAVRTFKPDVDLYLPQLDSVCQVLGNVREGLSEILPDVKTRALYGVITPFRQSVITSDSVTLVGLNHYLGADYGGYDGFEDYVRRLKIVDRIPFDVTEATIAVDYPYVSTESGVVLDRMLYEGALIYVMTRVIPDADARKVLAYTPEQWEWALENEADAWASLASRQLLYSTDRMVSAKLNNPSSATSILHKDAPGMLGRFIGYRIVESYMRNNQSTEISTLLTPEFYNSRASLVNSGYSPVRR